MEKNLKLVCPKCGEYHNPNSIHSMDVSDFVEGDILIWIYISHSVTLSKNSTPLLISIFLVSFMSKK